MTQITEAAPDKEIYFIVREQFLLFYHISKKFFHFNHNCHFFLTEANNFKKILTVNFITFFHQSVLK